MRHGQAAPDGGEFQVNSYTTGFQVLPKVATDPEGDYVVVWDSYGSSGTDSSYWSIQAQRFHVPSIFTDGFESGDSTVWTSSVT